MSGRSPRRVELMESKAGIIKQESAGDAQVGPILYKMYF